MLELFKEVKALQEEQMAEDLQQSDFAAEMEANRLKKERLQQERLAANKNVLRSYRIKP